MRVVGRALRQRAGRGDTGVDARDLDTRAAGRVCVLKGVWNLGDGRETTTSVPPVSTAMPMTASPARSVRSVLIFIRD